MFEELVESFTNDYITEFGERTLRKIDKKLDNSRSVRRYLIKLQEINVEPLGKDLVICVMNMPYFMVAKRETVAMGAVLLLLKWNNLLNENNRLASDFVLQEIFKSVLFNSRDL